ncbi:hypothetical protein F5Y19DRAFT_444193 [Xylariaceae sp. FL1651]|nr:hypothetical protein F5Y19DRAFT_444193 [Xylariaceae sp. FL1651]
MAGHNFSRYMLNLCSALFAPFNFLFTRIWRFFAQATAKGDHSSVPSEKNPTPSSPSSTPAPQSASVSALALVTVSPRTLHDQNSPHSITGEGGLGDTGPDKYNGNSNRNHTDLEYASDFSSQDQQQQSMEMANKRNAQRRGGARPSIHRPTTITPMTPVAHTTNNRPASTGQLDNNNSGDTGPNPIYPNGNKSTSFRRGGARGRGRFPLVRSEQGTDNHKENAASPNDSHPTPGTAHSDTPALTPLAVTDNASEPQKPGTRSYRTANTTSTTSAVNTMCDGSSASYTGVDRLHVAADRLTLNDTSSSQQPVQANLNEATTAAEAPAVPVPYFVAVPLFGRKEPKELDTSSQSQSQSSCQPESPETPNLPGLIAPTTDEERAEREYHLKYMREALDMGLLALNTNETPVGCVLVYRGKIIAKGMNATNVTRNGTRHAEFMALSALLSRRGPSDVKVANINPDPDHANWGDVDPKDGHIYPYGQKLHPAPVVDRSIISECVLYVTVEPCVMCASLLRQLGIQKVYFGAVNDKFGGTGGVFRVHMNSKPVAIPHDRPYQQGYGPQELDRISKGRAVALPREADDGDGGNVEPGYPVEGGYLRDDAVSLLRRFYVQENGRAPQPRKKEGRAARLYAALENRSKTGNASDLSDNTPETPVEAEAPAAVGVGTGLPVAIACD